MSSRDMTLTELKQTSKAFNDTHTVKVSGFKDGSNKITAAYVLEVTTKLINDLAHQISDLRDEMRKGFAKQEQFNKAIMARIDNLVVKNNLKE